MNEAAIERTAVRLPFRWLVIVALGLAAIAFMGGRYIYKRHAGYRPLALMHVPQTMRYRARVSLRDDPKRLGAVTFILSALDKRARRGSALEQKLGGGVGDAARELAFGRGQDASDFVVAMGLQLDAARTRELAKSVCDVAREDGIRSEPTESGCRLADGGLIAATADGVVLLASRAALVKDLLGRADIGDRLGFSGPSVRGAAPELRELEREAQGLASVLAAKYP